MMLISTLLEAPGHTIVTTHGPVFGLSVRARNALAQTGARFQAILGGEIAPMTMLLSSSRHDAVTRLSAAAAELGAHAVLGVRVEVSDLGGSWLEVCAYGTAVTLDPPLPTPAMLIECPDCAEPLAASSSQCPFCGAQLEHEPHTAEIA